MDTRPPEVLPETSLPRPRVRKSWFARPYPVLAAVLCVVALPVFLTRLPVCCDFGQHASAMERIKANPFHPANPLIATSGDGSPYFSPYTVVGGLLAEMTESSGWEVMTVFAVVNLLLLLTGVHAVTRILSPRPFAPVLALAAVTLLWGTQPAAWSGYLSLQSLALVVSYPSTFAAGLMLHLWALAGRTARLGGPSIRYAWMGFLASVILLTHPITALSAGIGVFAFVAGWQRRWSREVVARWGLMMACLVIPGLLWPYYSVFGLVGDPTVDSIHEDLYTDLFGWYGLALIGLPALFLRWERNVRDPLVIMFVSACAVAAYGRYTGHYTYGRSLGVFLLALQLALVVELSRRTWSRTRICLTLMTSITASVALVVQIGAVAAFAPGLLPKGPKVLAVMPRPQPWADYGWAASHVQPGDVVLTNGKQSMRMMPAHGAFTVAPAWPDPSVSAAARERRAADLRVFLQPGTEREEQRRILHRYGVRWLLLGKHDAVPKGPGYRVVAETAGTGERLVRVAL